MVEELKTAALSNDVIATPIEEVWLTRERGILDWPD